MIQENIFIQMGQFLASKLGLLLSVWQSNPHHYFHSESSCVTWINKENIPLTTVQRPLALSVDWLLLVTWLHYARRRRVESWQAVELSEIRTARTCFFPQCQSGLLFNPLNVKTGYTHIRQRSADETAYSWKCVLWLSCYIELHIHILSISVA